MSTIIALYHKEVSSMCGYTCQEREITYINLYSVIFMCPWLWQVSSLPSADACSHPKVVKVIWSVSRWVVWKYIWGEDKASEANVTKVCSKKKRKYNIIFQKSKPSLLLRLLFSSWGWFFWSRFTHTMPRSESDGVMVHILGLLTSRRSIHYSATVTWWLMKPKHAPE